MVDAFVSKELFESKIQSLFSKLKEHEGHLAKTEASLTGIRNDVSAGFQSLYNAINENKQNSLKGTNTMFYAIFGIFATLFGLVVYFGELKVENIKLDVLAQETIFEQKIENSKLESIINTKNLEIQIIKKL